MLGTNWGTVRVVCALNASLKLFLSFFSILNILEITWHLRPCFLVRALVSHAQWGILARAPEVSCTVTQWGILALYDSHLLDIFIFLNVDFHTYTFCTQVSVVTFANRANTELGFSDYDNKESLQTALEELPYGNGGNTNTSGGIREMMENAFDVENGHRIGENGHRTAGGILQADILSIMIFNLYHSVMKPSTDIIFIIHV